MQYMKAIDWYTYGGAVRRGQIRLQRGQWLSLGQDHPYLSRFHSINNAGVVIAFHGPKASELFRQYCAPS